MVNAPDQTARNGCRTIRVANFSVEMVSSRCRDSGHMLAIIRVMLFPPSESRRTCVSFDERNGMWSRCFVLRAMTTCSRNDRDRLIYSASC